MPRYIYKKNFYKFKALYKNSFSDYQISADFNILDNEFLFAKQKEFEEELTLQKAVSMFHLLSNFATIKNGNYYSSKLSGEPQIGKREYYDFLDEEYNNLLKQGIPNSVIDKVMSSNSSGDDVINDIKAIFENKVKGFSEALETYSIYKTLSSRLLEGFVVVNEELVNLKKTLAEYYDNNLIPSENVIKEAKATFEKYKVLDVYSRYSEMFAKNQSELEYKNTFNVDRYDNEPIFTNDNPPKKYTDCIVFYQNKLNSIFKPKTNDTVRIKDGKKVYAIPVAPDLKDLNKRMDALNVYHDLYLLHTNRPKPSTPIEEMQFKDEEELLADFKYKLEECNFTDTQIETAQNERISDVNLVKNKQQFMPYTKDENVVVYNDIGEFFEYYKFSYKISNSFPQLSEFMRFTDMKESVGFMEAFDILSNKILQGEIVIKSISLPDSFLEFSKNQVNKIKKVPINKSQTERINALEYFYNKHRCSELLSQIKTALETDIKMDLVSKAEGKYKEYLLNNPFSLEDYANGKIGTKSFDDINLEMIESEFEHSNKNDDINLENEGLLPDNLFTSELPVDELEELISDKIEEIEIAESEQKGKNLIEVDLGDDEIDLYATNLKDAPKGEFISINKKTKEVKKLVINLRDLERVSEYQEDFRVEEFDVLMERFRTIATDDSLFYAENLLDKYYSNMQMISPDSYAYGEKGSPRDAYKKIINDAKKNNYDFKTLEERQKYEEADIKINGCKTNKKNFIINLALYKTTCDKYYSKDIFTRIWGYISGSTKQERKLMEVVGKRLKDDLHLNKEKELFTVISSAENITRAINQVATQTTPLIQSVKNEPQNEIVKTNETEVNNNLIKENNVFEEEERIEEVNSLLNL